MQPSDSVHILVVHEDPIVAAGLKAVFEMQQDLAVTMASSASSWVRADPTGCMPCQVVVADYQGGLDLMAEFREGTGAATRTPKVLVVTQSAREWEVRFAMNAGVYGYILQSCSVEEILSGVRTVGSNRRYMCGAVTERIAESLTRVTLTARETEVLELLQSGMCNKTIARDLGIAPGTVKAHVKGILEKLESTTRTQAVAVATHRGLIKASLDQPGISAWRSGRGSLASNYPASERLHLQLAA